MTTKTNKKYEITLVDLKGVKKTVALANSGSVMVADKLQGFIIDAAKVVQNRKAEVTQANAKIKIENEKIEAKKEKEEKELNNNLIEFAKFSHKIDEKVQVISILSNRKVDDVNIIEAIGEKFYALYLTNGNIEHVEDLSIKGKVADIQDKREQIEKLIDEIAELKIEAKEFATKHLVELHKREDLQPIEMIELDYSDIKDGFADLPIKEVGEHLPYAQKHFLATILDIEIDNGTAATLEELCDAVIKTAAGVEDTEKKTNK